MKNIWDVRFEDDVQYWVSAGTAKSAIDKAVILKKRNAKIGGNTKGDIQYLSSRPVKSVELAGTVDVE